jgi:hypothetical protein
MYLMDQNPILLYLEPNLILKVLLQKFMASLDKESPKMDDLVNQERCPAMRNISSPLLKQYSWRKMEVEEE